MNEHSQDIDLEIFEAAKQPLRVDDFIAGQDLSVARALTQMSKQEQVSESDTASYAALYEWFQVNTGTVGPRHLGEQLPGVGFKHAAQRGIHAPAKRKYAATVTIKKNSLYKSGSDGQRLNLGDGTWLIFYSAHRNNTGGSTETIWNQRLFNCMVDGIPVGLFLQESSSSDSYFRALVFVEEYDPDTDLFTLHGPVTPSTENLFKSSVASKESISYATFDPSIQEMQEDRRTSIVAKQKTREGQERFRQDLIDAYDGKCAVTGMSTNKVLQAAHILDYRGTQSNIVPNGLLLRSDIHLLYDSYLLGINPSSHRIEVRSDVPDSVYTDLDGVQIHLPKDAALRPNEQYLEAKYGRFCCV